MPDSLIQSFFEFAELAQHHSGSNRSLLNSLSHTLPDQSAGASSSSCDYYRSREWQQLFPSLVETEDKFSTLSTAGFMSPSLEDDDSPQPLGIPETPYSVDGSTADYPKCSSLASRILGVPRQAPS
ncbi:MAG: hypothetical protein Q8P67_01520, partial [archaeon]|nr:hypothetical protein [archaeon]